MYQATLVFPDKDLLSKCYLPEARTDERVSVKVRVLKQKFKTNINAEDATSLRATLTTLTKLLSVYEKIKVIA